MVATPSQRTSDGLKRRSTKKHHPESPSDHVDQTNLLSLQPTVLAPESSSDCLTPHAWCLTAPQKNNVLVEGSPTWESEASRTQMNPSNWPQHGQMGFPVIKVTKVSQKGAPFRIEAPASRPDRCADARGAPDAAVLLTAGRSLVTVTAVLLLVTTMSPQNHETGRLYLTTCFFTVVD